MRALHYPDYTDLNPYQSLMFAGLKENGIDIFAFRGPSRSLLKKVVTEKADVLHLHWINMAVTNGSLPHALASMLTVYVSLILWRLKGTRILWTVHNLNNHGRYRVRLERFHARMIGALSHRLLVHGQSAVEIAAAHLSVKPGKISVAYHGNYDGTLSAQPASSKQDGPAQDGIKVLFAGRIEPYKGVPDLIEAFSALDGTHALRIAGKVSDATLRAEIETRAAEDPRIHCDLRFLPDEELEDMMGWSDVIALPYHDIFTSGSLMLALTAGRPVIAPRIGLIPEYVSEDVAFFYDPQDETGLQSALDTAATSTNLVTRAARARDRADSFDWSTICSVIVQAYKN